MVERCNDFVGNNLLRYMNVQLFIILVTGGNSMILYSCKVDAVFETQVQTRIATPLQPGQGSYAAGIRFFSFYIYIYIYTRFKAQGVQGARLIEATRNDISRQRLVDTKWGNCASFF